MTVQQRGSRVLPEYAAVIQDTVLRKHELHCHPATRAGVALSLSAQVQLTERECVLRYSLLGNMASLRIPPPAPKVPADGLWQHTCFEAFVAVDGAQGYREFNFSPSGQWAVYRFKTERLRDTVEDRTQPILEVSRGADSLELTARWPKPDVPASAPQHWGLCAVIEEADGRLSYWALAHPKDRPDFHHRDGRALCLSSP